MEGDRGATAARRSSNCGPFITGVRRSSLGQRGRLLTRVEASAVNLRIISHGSYQVLIMPDGSLSRCSVFGGREGRSTEYSCKYSYAKLS